MTDSFQNAYRRFVGLRRPVRQLRSDQVLNFVGARNELALALTAVNYSVITRELAKNACDWIQMKINVPMASYTKWRLGKTNPKCLEVSSVPC